MQGDVQLYRCNRCGALIDFSRPLEEQIPTKEQREFKNTLHFYTDGRMCFSCRHELLWCEEDDLAQTCAENRSFEEMTIAQQQEARRNCPCNACRTNIAYRKGVKKTSAPPA